MTASPAPTLRFQLIPDRYNSFFIRIQAIIGYKLKKIIIWLKLWTTIFQLAAIPQQFAFFTTYHQKILAFTPLNSIVDLNVFSYPDKWSEPGVSLVQKSANSSIPGEPYTCLDGERKVWAEGEMAGTADRTNTRNYFEVPQLVLSSLGRGLYQMSKRNLKILIRPADRRAVTAHRATPKTNSFTCLSAIAIM